MRPRADEPSASSRASASPPRSSRTRAGFAPPTETKSPESHNICEVKDITGPAAGLNVREPRDGHEYRPRTLREENV